MAKYDKEKKYVMEITEAETKNGMTLGHCPKCRNVTLIITDNGLFCPCCNTAIPLEYVRWRKTEPSSVSLPATEYTKEKQIMYRLMQEAQWLYAGWLKRTPKAIEYAESRGLDENDQKEFGIGYGGSIFSMLSQHYSTDILIQSGLFYKSNEGEIKERFYHRLIIPILNINGQIIGFGGRLTHPQKKAAKYINSPESIIFDKGSNLYGMHVAKQYAQKGLILCEGYMDAIALHKAGFKSAIASLGTALTPQQAFMISLFTRRVYLSYDSDAAGIKAAVKAINTLNEAGIRDIRLINMNPHKDPDEFLQKRGRDEFIKRLSHAARSSSYMTAYYAYLYKHGKLSEYEMYDKIAEVLQWEPANLVHRTIVRNRLNERFLIYKIKNYSKTH